MKRRAVLCCVLTTIGCAPDPIESAREAIIGGSPSTDPGVVLLLGRRPGSTDAELCSGFVVSPRIVVTAAHCVSSLVVTPDTYFEVFFGDALQPVSKTVAIKEVIVHPDFSPDRLSEGHDVAIAVLPSSAAATPLPLNRDPLDASLVDQAVRIVGFGITRADDTVGATSGARRTTRTRITDVTDALIRRGDADHNSCAGDSGGPSLLVMADGVERVIGVASYGDPTCAGPAADTRVDQVASFIDDSVAQVNAKAGGCALSHRPDRGALAFMLLLLLVRSSSAGAWLRSRARRASRVPS
jgi:secreted trypsin-like serine protease